MRYIFLVKYTNVYSQQLTAPHTRINTNLHNLNLFYHILGKQHEGRSSKKNSITPDYINLENIKYTKKLFQIISLVAWSYGCTTHFSLAVNRKVWGTRLILKPCPEHCGFCVSLRCKFVQKDSARPSHR